MVSLRHQKLYAGSRDPMGGAADRLRLAPSGRLVADHGDLAPLDSGRRAYAGDSARTRHPPQPNPRRGVPVTRPGALGFYGGAGVGPSSRHQERDSSNVFSSLTCRADDDLSTKSRVRHPLDFRLRMTRMTISMMEHLPQAVLRP